MNQSIDNTEKEVQSIQNRLQYSQNFTVQAWLQKMAVSSKATVTLGQRLWNALSAWTVRQSGYQKLGLLREDLYDDEYQPDIIEAIRRLPEHERNLRQYRIKRALDLSMKHAHLPKEQWTKPEEDVPYLTPYIERVKKEMLEMKSWNRQ